MPHVDEGRMHAYLDGALAADERSLIEAHTATCADCRARLDQAASRTRRAHDLLDAAAAPVAQAPPFEALVARARARRARPHAWTRLAWAATVALALATGWYARAMLGPRPAPSVVLDGGAQAAPPRTNPTQSPGAQPEPGSSASPARATARQQVERPLPRADRTATGRAMASREGAGGAGAQSAQPTGAAGMVTRPDSALRDELRAAAQPVPAAPDQLKSLGEEAAPPAARARAAFNVTAPHEADLARDTLWTAVDPGGAQRRLDGPLAEVTGLRTVSLMSGAWEGNPVIRRVQLLADGTMIELFQSRPALEPGPTAARPEPPPTAGESMAGRTAPIPMAQSERKAPTQEAGANTVTVRWNGYDVTARAALPRDSLRLLLRRLGRAQSP